MAVWASWASGDESAATAETSLADLQRAFAAEPLGEVLAAELQLDRLEEELARVPRESASLDRLARGLRRVLPGPDQQLLDRLRAAVERLARRARLAEEGPAARDAARAALERHLQATPGTSSLSDADLRRAFATVAACASGAEEESAVRRLRERLSVPNFSVLVGRRYVETISRRQFSRPIVFQEQRDGTVIDGQGTVTVSLTATVPPSAGENRLVVHAVGTGQIAASANRQRVHVAASAVPDVTGSNEVRLTPREVAVEPPRVEARFTTRLSALGIDGLLGRCRLVQRMARRAIQKALAANDPVVARQIEQAVAEKTEDEAASLAYRINGLVQWGVWDRLAAVDFTPEVRLTNDAFGIRSDTWYAGDDQLGGIFPRPTLPPAALARLDMVTWAHESVVNNSLAALAGARLDEATVRGIWEVQCKLGSEDWEKLPPARIPAVIRLATDHPLAVRLDAEGLGIVMRATACELAGRVVDDQPRVIRLRYQLDRDGEGWRFTRERPVIEGPLAEETAAAWEDVIDLFFGRSIRPLPRYRPSGFSRYLKVAHLDVRDGWLVVGASRVAADVDAAEGSR